MVAFGRMSTRHAKDRDNTSCLPATEPPNLQQSLEAARAARGTGGQAELDLWEQALALDPASISALLNAARCAIGLGEADRAIELTDRACTIRPDDAACATWLARACEAADRPEDAVRAWERVSELQPSSGVHLRAARLAARLNQPSRAIEHYRAVVRLDPDSPRAHAALARTLWDAGAREQAQQVAEDAMARLPTAVEPVLEAARIAQLQGLPADALVLWQRALDLDPVNATALQNATRCATDLGDTARAVDLAEQAASAHPGNVAYVISLARALRAADRLQEAHAAWEQAITLESTAAAHTNAARCATLLGDHAAAAAHSRECIRLDPDNPRHHAALIRALWSNGDAATALSEGAACVARFPTAVEPAIEMGRMLQLMGERDESLRWWRHALALDPGNKTASIRVADALRQRGELEDAHAMIQGAIDRHGLGDPAIARSCARILIALGLFDLAIAAAGELDVATAAGRATVAELEGLAYLGQWDLRRAELLLAEACAGDPSPPRWASLVVCRLLAGDVRAAQSANEQWAASVNAARATSGRADDRVVRRTAGVLGEVINEILLDEGTARKAMSTVENGDPERAAALARAAPHALSAAMALTVTLRTSGILETAQRPDATDHNTIPRIIGQAWFGSPLPEDAATLVESWRAVHPGWEHLVFSSETATAWLGDALGGEAVLAFRRARHPAAKADLFRLGFLAVNGGLWCDIDDRARRSLEPLLDGRELVCWQETFGTIGNNVIGARPGHPVIQQALEEAIDNCRTGFSEAPWLATGPGLMTRSFARWVSQDVSAAELGTRVVVLEPFELARYVAVHQPLRYKLGPLAWQRSGGYVVDYKPPVPEVQRP